MLRRTRTCPGLVRGWVATLLVMALVGCGGGGVAPGPKLSLSPGVGGLALAGSCPRTVVIQSAWVPQAEYGALYRLVGPGYSVDTDRKRVTGPLMVDGKDTGVRIEIRAGGPATSFQDVSAQMYTDDSITLGQVATDKAIGQSAKHRVIAVVSPLDIAPYMIMWDPQRHPDFHSIVDIGQTDTTVVYINGAPYMDYLLGSGILRRSQVDGSYDGSPARFITSGDRVAQQGLATNELYTYENLLPQGPRPMKFQLIHDTGYPVYPEAIVVRADRKLALAACLHKLVPIIQRSEVDYVHDPAPTNRLIVDLVHRYNLGIAYPLAQADFSIREQIKLGIVSNGTGKILGGFDMNRIKRVIDITMPIYTGQRRVLKQGLKPDDIATNEFIDPSIGLKP